jgi:hypothetical protein
MECWLPIFFFNQRSCRYFTSPPGQVGASSGGLKGLRLNEWGHCRARKGDAIGVKSPRNELAASASTFFLSLSIHRRRGADTSRPLAAPMGVALAAASFEYANMVSKGVEKLNISPRNYRWPRAVLIADTHNNEKPIRTIEDESCRWGCCRQ